MDRLLVFDLWGDFGHFKKHYTTTSPLSFPFPPRTTIAGIIAAIAGIDKNAYLDEFVKTKASIAIRVLNDVRKMRLTENFINTKDLEKFLFAKFKNHTQIRLELVKNPRYRIYFYHTDTEFYSQLKNLLMGHKSVFTISLGLSEFLADFVWVGEPAVQKIIDDTWFDIHSVIPNDKDMKMEFEDNKDYFTTTIPIEMISGRIVTELNKVFYERRGGTIRCKMKMHWKIDYESTMPEERIVFL